MCGGGPQALGEENGAQEQRVSWPLALGCLAPVDGAQRAEGWVVNQSDEHCPPRAESRRRELVCGAEAEGGRFPYRQWAVADVLGERNDAVSGARQSHGWRRVRRSLALAG
jgi:hypothetical protein